jgi:hypothetical protein
MFKFEPLHDGSILVRVSRSGKLLGTMLREVDGDWYFYPTATGGWSQQDLSQIATELQKLNSETE